MTALSSARVSPQVQPSPHTDSLRRFGRADVLIAVSAAGLTVAAQPFGESSSTYAIAIAAITVVFGLANKRAAWVLYVLALCASGVNVAGGGSLLLEHAALIPIAFHVLTSRQPGTRKKRGGLTVAALAFAFWFAANAITSVIQSPDSGQSLRLMLWVGSNFVAAILVYWLPMRPANMARDALTVVAASAAGSVAMWGLATATSSPSIFVEQDYASAFFRLQGLMLEPNLLAALLFFASCVAVRFSRELPRALVVVFLVIAAVGIVLTFTRVAGALMVVLLITYLWPALSAIARVIAVIFGIAGALLFSNGSSNGGGGPTLLSTLGDRAAGLLDFGSGTGAFRVRTADLAINEIVQRGAFIGQGFNSFPQLHQSDQGSKGELYLGLLWLVIVYDGGVIGALFFLTGVIAVWASVGWKKGLLFFGGFALIASTTNPIWYVFPWVFAVLMVRARDSPEFAPLRQFSQPDATQMASLDSKGAKTR